MYTLHQTRRKEQFLRCPLGQEQNFNIDRDNFLLKICNMQQTQTFDLSSVVVILASLYDKYSWCSGNFTSPNN